MTNAPLTLVTGSMKSSREPRKWTKPVCARESERTQAALWNLSEPKPSPNSNEPDRVGTRTNQAGRKLPKPRSPANPNESKPNEPSGRGTKFLVRAGRICAIESHRCRKLRGSSWPGGVWDLDDRPFVRVTSPNRALSSGPPAVTSDRPLSARQEVSDENGRRGQPFSHRPTFPGSVNHAFSRSSSSTKLSRCLRRWSRWQSPRVLQTHGPRGKKR